MLPASTVNKPIMIVAAIACRPYVEAAVASGYSVVAIDAFADVEVTDLAEHCYQVQLSDGQLNMVELMQLLNGFDLHEYVGFCYGAGFEKQPAILSKINTLLPVIGNLEQAVSRCKTPKYFFALCEQLQLPYPSVRYDPPLSPVGWLRKEVGASGGSHVKPLDSAQMHAEQIIENEAVYYQQFQQGVAVSCLFIASNHDNQAYHVQIIGFNEQFVQPCHDVPFRYGGAVSHINISETAKVRLTEYISQLSQAIGLVGLNSCDVICDKDDVYVLEINPRLSATMGLYANNRLFEKHIAAVEGKAIEYGQACEKSCAFQIIYAECAVAIQDDIMWPDWVVDRSRSGSLIETGMPICTVIAQAETADRATMLVNERAAAIRRQFLN
jgi:uncharacterized protein